MIQSADLRNTVVKTKPFLHVRKIVSEGDEIDEKALFTFDLTADTDCARLGDKAFVIDAQNVNVSVKFQNINGKWLD